MDFSAGTEAIMWSNHYDITILGDILFITWMVDKILRAILPLWYIMKATVETEFPNILLY